MSYSVPKPEGEAPRAEGHYNHRYRKLKYLKIKVTVL